MHRPLPTHDPRFSTAEIARFRRWHERSERWLRERGTETIDHLGLTLVVPPGVFPPSPMSPLLGRAVLDEVRPGEHVLDMGTGSGVNAILAATRGAEVVGVDVNPAAAACARSNAAANGVAGRCAFVVGDVLDAVVGRWDLVVFDPPFRWFEPKDALDAAICDHRYEALGRFFRDVGSRLAPGGRLLVFFGTSGDIDHLLGLADAAGFAVETVAEEALAGREWTVDYRTMRMTPQRGAAGPGGG